MKHNKGNLKLYLRPRQAATIKKTLTIIDNYNGILIRAQLSRT